MQHQVDFFFSAPPPQTARAAYDPEQTAKADERKDGDTAANRFYASGFHSYGTDGVALVTAKKAYYFTDSRYTEAALRYVQGAEVREIGHGRGYGALLEEAVTEQHIRRMGFEDAYMTVQDHERYRKALSCDLVPATDLLWQLRMVKDEEELEAMVAAQRIAERALEDILEEIRPGLSHLLTARTTGFLERRSIAATS